MLRDVEAVRAEGCRKSAAARLVCGVVAFTVLAAAACERDGSIPRPLLPTAPSGPVTPGPSSWVGSSRIIAITGSGECAATEQRRVGEVWQRHFLIDRSDTSIVMTTAFGPDVTYTGTVEGLDFTAEDRGDDYVANIPCGRQLSYYGGITGRFSEDARNLTATEFWASRLAGGGEMRIVFELSLSR